MPDHDDPWYYTQDGCQHGPASAHVIRHLAAAGILKPTDLLWKRGMGRQWLEAGSIPTLFPPDGPNGDEPH